MHRRALQQQRQVTLAAQQGLHPVGHLHGRGFTHTALFDPGAGALHQPHQPGAYVVPQRLHPRVFAPLGHTGAEQGGQLWQQRVQLARRRCGTFGAAAAAFGALLLVVASQQSVELLRHQFAVGVQVVQERAQAAVAQGLGDPQQVVVAGGQHVGLLVVQVLDAVLDPAEEFVRTTQCIGGVLAHQPGMGHTLQCGHGGAGAQLGELAAAHHLQQLHGEFDLADATA